MSEITVKVVNEEGKPVYFARVGVSARVIVPRFVADEGRVEGIDIQVMEVASRTNERGIAVVSERPAPRWLGPLGPLVILARAAQAQAVTPFVDWCRVSGNQVALHP